MSLVKWNQNSGVLSPLSSMMDNFFKGESLIPARFLNDNALPAVNVSETDTMITVEVAAPGMDKKDFKIQVDKGVLKIGSEKESTVEKEEDNYTRKEFTYSSFERSFIMPDNTKEDEINATYEKGLLCITIPKTEVGRTQEVKTVEVV